MAERKKVRVRVVIPTGCIRDGTVVTGGTVKRFAKLRIQTRQPYRKITAR